MRVTNKGTAGKKGRERKGGKERVTTRQETIKIKKQGA